MAARLKVLTVVGTRPEIIRLSAPYSARSSRILLTGSPMREVLEQNRKQINASDVDRRAIR